MSITSMKTLTKFLEISLVLVILSLVLPAQIEAKINWPWQVREQLNLTGTPSARPTAKEERKEIKQGLVEQIEGKLGWLLPFGFNRVELKTISGTILPADLTVSRDDKVYMVKVTDKTILLRKFGGKSELSEFSVGDTLSVRGKWTDEAKTILEARVIRNLSVQKRKGTFWGTIKSKGNNTFVLASVNRGEQAVYLGSDTKIFNRKQETITFADLKIGDRVRVSGLWDSKLNKITEVTRIKDWSIPPKVTPSAGSGLSPTP